MFHTDSVQQIKSMVRSTLAHESNFEKEIVLDMKVLPAFVLAVVVVGAQALPPVVGPSSTIRVTNNAVKHGVHAKASASPQARQRLTIKRR